MASEGSPKVGRRRPYRRQFLVFIDTNIFLDFYKTSQPKGLSLLSHLDSIGDRVITTEQVAMEFKKNRQKVILEAMEALKVPSPISPPLFLADAAAAHNLAFSIKEAARQVQRMKRQLKGLLNDPKGSDEVYRASQKHFDNFTELNLHRRNEATAKLRFMIRRLARKRFQLGYPPRKRDDTSMGDAINWEWIIHCAAVTHKHVVIVSRDSDYGAALNDREVYINDWLKEEFIDRTSPLRQIKLTKHLAGALKLAGVPVSSKEEAVERGVIEEAERARAQADGPASGAGTLLDQVLRYFAAPQKEALANDRRIEEWLEQSMHYSRQHDRDVDKPGPSTPGLDK